MSNWTLRRPLLIGLPAGTRMIAYAGDQVMYEHAAFALRIDRLGTFALDENGEWIKVGWSHELVYQPGVAG